MVGRGQMLHPFDDGRRGFIRGGPGPLGPPLRHPLDMLPPLAAMERKLVVEEAEIQRLLVENQKLAENHVLLRQQLALEQQEASRLQEGLAKIHAEKADQMRLWTERAAKMEADVRALNPLKAELQRTQADVQKLLAQRQEYGSQAQQLQDEIVRIRSDLQRLPARKAEIEAMQQELIRARSAYEAEKNAHADLVEQRQSIDKNMIDMAREIERLRAELIEVDKKMQGDSGYPAIGSNPYRASYDLGQTYLGIQIFRFYFKCTRCSAELTMKTDPQNSDYTVEAGATRNFEPWRAEDEAVDDAKKKRDAEEMGDAMKALENRTVDSKREMDILTALDEMKSMRARHASVGPEELLEAIRRTSELKEKKLAEQDEALIRSVVFQNSQSFVHRLDDDEDEEDDEDDIATGSSSKRTKFEPKPGGPSATEHLTEQISSDQTKATADITKACFGIRPQNVAFHIKPKKAISTRTEEEPHVEPSGGQSSSNCNASRTGLDSLVATYDSDSSD